MTTTETVAILCAFNEWRRGDYEPSEQPEPPDPCKISEAIDAAIAMIERLEAAEKERDALRAKLEAVEKELEVERMRLAACGVAALGYFNGCAKEYESASLYDVMELRAKNDALRAAMEKIADWYGAWGPYPETNKSWCAMAIVTAREAVKPLTNLCAKGEEK